MVLMKKKKPEVQLYLRIHANAASELFPKQENLSSLNNPSNLTVDSNKSKNKNVNPVLVAQLNGASRKSSKKVNTTLPSWDDVLEIPLLFDDYSPVLVLNVWDKHRRYKNYMGELRVNLEEIFAKSMKTDLKWYKLHSSKVYQGFITGSLLLSFELVAVEKKKAKKKSPREQTLKQIDKLESHEDLYGITQPVSSTENLNEAEVEQLKAEELQQLFEEWLELLLEPKEEVQNETVPDEQGFYLAVPTTSVPSILESTQLAAASVNSGRLSALTRYSDSEMSIFSQDSIRSPTKKFDALSLKEGSSSVKKPLKRSDDTKNFHVYKRKMLGVLFLEIVSASDLPRLRNFTRTSYDVDPFVVVTFGKRTFRTSWKRHTLNPIFNERLVFEIQPHERYYNVQFSILDRDSLSFHDDVCDVSLNMSRLADMAKVENDVTINDSLGNPDSDVSKTDRDLGKSDGEELKLSVEDNDNDSEVALDTLDKEEPMTDKTIKISEDPNMAPSYRKRRFKRKITFKYADTSNFKTFDLSMNVKKEKYKEKHNPTLKIRARFQTYESLRKQFWIALLEQYQMSPEGLDYIEIISLLDTLGCEDSDKLTDNFFEKLNKSVWSGATCSNEEVLEFLESIINRDEGIFHIEVCPICCQKRLTKKQDKDIITHFAICASKDWSIVSKLLLQLYDTPQLATKKWFLKVLIKMSYGKYKLGSNLGNILVQDRTTGIVVEEKMGIYVRLGIRLLYKGLDSARRKKIRLLLRLLSVKQGKKFDSPKSKSSIRLFIKFHLLDMSDCLESDPDKYDTFNDFFYRKLKPGARPIAGGGDDRVMVSPADCRSTYYCSVDEATEFWIKGKNFLVAKLFGGTFANLEKTDLYSASRCSLAIFRLAPQDYHRFHSPVAGTVKYIKKVEGEYYTVNPMAIRSQLDVYGENVRTLVAIETQQFGTVVMACIGAMMVGLIVMLVEEGQTVSRGDEIGYFKFGGLTVVVLVESQNFEFDQDLIDNLRASVETLVRVGQSVGHHREISELEHKHVDFASQTPKFKINLIRVLTGGDRKSLSNWEAEELACRFGEAEIEKDEVDVNNKNS